MKVRVKCAKIWQNKAKTNTNQRNSNVAIDEETGRYRGAFVAKV
jgi:hypothetical protein